MASHEVQDVDPNQARQLIDAGWRVIDVRTDAEWADGHLAGPTTCRWTRSWRRSAATSTTRCSSSAPSGGRSTRVAQYLAAQGVETANLDGGLHAWEDAGLPLER